MSPRTYAESIDSYYVDPELKAVVTYVSKAGDKHVLFEYLSPDDFPSPNDFPEISDSEF